MHHDHSDCMEDCLSRLIACEYSVTADIKQGIGLCRRAAEYRRIGMGMTCPHVG